MISSLSSFANIKSNPLKNHNSKGIISIYVQAFTEGNYENSKYFLADDFEFYNPKRNMSVNKREYVKFLKNTTDLKYNCETNYEILEESTDVCIAKTTMKFENFTRIDYITLRLSEEGWKIAKIVSTYPN